MIRTVDLVVSGDGRASLAAAADALRCGRRVLVVLPFGDARVARRARRYLRRVAHAVDGQMTIMANARVVCVDGIGGVEAVVVRYARTGRLCAVNATSLSRGSDFDGRVEA